MRRVRNGEVQVCRKTVGLEEAFLETRATLEQPRVADFRMLPGACQQPAQRVILVHHLRVEPQIGGELQHLLPADYGVARSQPWGSHSRQAVASCFAGSVGSSFA